ncbi:MAG: hypothetical protein IPH78_07580 [Bacteroidetes bacterium]|nr:hypothetical protein [Bacteroidota bacterium]MBK8657907.1 hypothetical protein [Bacteroidota bacterium]
MKSSLNALHHQCSDWMRELAFYKEELSLLNGRLGEIAKKNNTGEVLAEVEHFQNKFIVQNEQLDILKHDVNKCNEDVLAKAKEAPTHLDEKTHSVNEELHARMKDFTKYFADLRMEFNKFAGKVL